MHGARPRFWAGARTVVLSLALTVAIVALLTACADAPKKQSESSVGTAGVARKSIRFYSANKRGQEDRLALVRNTSQYGCQNLSAFRKAYRVAVIGFKTCVVYSEQDCPQSAAVVARWDGSARRDPNKQQPTITLTAGTSWIIGYEGEKKPNVPIRSWSCR